LEAASTPCPNSSKGKDEGIKIKSKAKHSKFNLLQQALRERGLTYQSVRREKDGTLTNKQREAKVLLPPCEDYRRCRKSPMFDCNSFDEEERKKIFASFWESTWEAKRSLVCSLVEKVPVARRTSDAEFERQSSVRYYLYHSGRKAKLRVCSVMFGNTFGLSNARIFRWALKKTRKKAVMTPDVQRKKPARKVVVSERTETLKSFLVSLSKNKALLREEKFVRGVKHWSMRELHKYYKSQVQNPLERTKFSEIMHELNLTVEDLVKQ
jgi:hypothetical protein